MINLAIPAFVALLQVLQPLFASGSLSNPMVEMIINGLLQLAPQLGTLAAAEITAVQNIAADFQSSADLTDAQMAAMDDFDARCDAAFEAAAKAAGV